MVEVSVDVFWPNPMSVDGKLIDHKCHRSESISIPSAFFMSSNNEAMLALLSKRYKDPYSGESLIVKANCIYREDGAPEKIIIFLKAPLREPNMTFLEGLQRVNEPKEQDTERECSSS